MSDSIIAAFADRIEQLRPSERVSKTELKMVRQLAAQRFRTQVRDEGYDKKTIAALDAAIVRLVGELGDDVGDTLIEREEGARLAIPFPGRDDPVPTPRDTLAMGPFLTGTGFPRDVLILRGKRWTEIRMKGSDQTAMFIPAGGVSGTTRKINISVEKDTLWIRADLLADIPMLDESRPLYFAIPVLRAQGRFSAAGKATLTAPPTGRLEIELDYPKRSVTVCEDVALLAPQSLIIEFDSSGDVTIDLSDGAVTTSRERTTLKPTGKVIYDAQHKRLVFLAKAAPETMSLGAFTHKFATVKGDLPIDVAGWAMPLQAPSGGGSFPATAPAGGWIFKLEDKARAFWDGLSDDVMITKPWLEVALDGWQIAGDGQHSGAMHPFQGWQLEDGSQPLDVALTNAEPVVIGCDRANGEFVGFVGAFEETIYKPVDTSGAPIRLDSTGVSVVLSQFPDKKRSVNIKPIERNFGPSGQFAIENVLFSARGIALAAIHGVMDGPNLIGRGRLLLGMDAFAWLPILPDPYVTNLDASLVRQSTSRLQSEVIWTQDDVDVVLFGGFNLDGIETALRSNPGSRGTDINPGNQRKDGQTARGRQLRSKKDRAQQAKLARQLDDFQGAAVSQRGDRVWRKYTNEYDGPQVRLLDVSTRRDQIGVTFDMARGQGGTSFRLNGMRMLTGLSDLRVFALPQIQWEPVRTLDADQNPIDVVPFPSPLASPDDGGAMQMASNAATLAPVIPDLTVNAMIDAFANGEPMRMTTTLPFGIKSLMELRPTDDAEQEADTVRKVTPAFAEPQVVGGLQLALEAGAAKGRGPIADPGFRGASYQLPNGVNLETGAPYNLSVLGDPNEPSGSVEAMFNQEFLLSRPKVPLKRYDVSGYGASTFSDWRNPLAAFAEASKVEFQVMVGRTALEIIKFVSVLYPWGIRVTRSVTIERGAGAGVIRKDSGWQPTSDGLLDFRYVPEGMTDPVASPYVVHPGLIRGVFDVQRIRPADRGRIELTSGAAVLPMVFDAEVEIGTDQSSTRAASQGMLGYLHLEPVGEPITPDDLEELLGAMGPAGGPIDSNLAIDTSGLNCRMTRVEVGSSPDGSGPAFAGAVLGMPKFGSAGSWSVVAFAGPAASDDPPEALIIDEGVPFIRRGRAGDPREGRIYIPSPSIDINLANPEDLFQLGAPETDYAFLQTCSTHSFVYRRPSVRLGETDIRSGLPPLFADVLVRTTGSALFPPEDVAITLPNNTRLSANNPAGVPVLKAPVSMAVTRPPVKITDDGSTGGKLHYNGTTLSLDIGTDDWSVRMPGMEIQNTILGIEDVTGLRFDLRGGSTDQDRLDNMKSLLGGFFGDLFDVIPGISPERDVPPYDLRATNQKSKVKLKVQSSFGGKIAKGLKLYGLVYNEVGSEEIDVPEDKVPEGAEDFDLQVSQGYFGAGIGFELDGKIDLGGGYLFVVRVFWDIGYKVGFGADIPGGGEIGSKLKVVSTTRVEAGVGYGGEYGPIEAYGTLTGIFLYIVETDSLAFGVGIRFEFKAAFLIVEIKAYMEALGILLLEDGKKYVKGQAEVGISVKIAVFFSVKFSIVVSVKGEI